MALKKNKNQTTTKKLNAPEINLDLQKQFIKQFGYLPSKAPQHKALINISKKVLKIRTYKGKIIIDFEYGARLIASPPALVDQLKKWPVSMKKLLKNHADIIVGSRSGSYQVSPEWSLAISNFNEEDLITGESKLLNMVKNTNEILCAVANQSNWWLLHPTKKLKSGEPALMFFCHENCKESRLSSLGAGDFFIKNMNSYLTQNSKHKQHLCKMKTLPKMTKEQSNERSNFDEIINDICDDIYKIYKNKASKSRVNKSSVEKASALLERFYSIYKPRNTDFTNKNLMSDIEPLEKWLLSIKKRWN